MNERDPSRPEFRELAQAFEALEPTPALRTRVLAGARPESHVRVRPALVGTLAMAVGVAIGFGVHRDPPPSESIPIVAVVPHPVVAAVEPAELGRFRLANDCTASLEGDELIAAAGCRLELAEAGVRVDVWEPTRLRSTANGLAMRSGVAAFDVRTRRPEEPSVEVDVGAGTIRVLGTRFVVTAGPERGHVDLIEGHIAFESRAVGPRDHEALDVLPGQRLVWHSEGIVAPAHPSGSPSVPASKAPSVPEFSLGAELQEVAALRRRGEFATAQKIVRRLLRKATGDETRAVLSYELGTLLEAAGEHERACRHWSAHIRSYAGRGPGDAAQRRERLHCGDDE